MVPSTKVTITSLQGQGEAALQVQLTFSPVTTAMGDPALHR
jgi:hypothetical protein